MAIKVLGGVTAILAMLVAGRAMAQPSTAPAPAAAPEAQQPLAQSPPPKAVRPHRHKTPNLEMDVDGDDQDAQPAGPTTSTDRAPAAEPLTGWDGPTSTFPEYPTPPLPPPPPLQEQAPALLPPTAAPGPRV